MTKILTAVVLVFTTLSVSYADDMMLNPALSTKNLVRVKLWYDGIEVPQDQQNAKEAPLNQMPEEISVAIDALDS